MARTVSIGTQDFETLISRNNFYVDKTHFIKEWWESDDSVTLIARPRRFGKTLNMNMLERFFSVEYKGQGQIFEHLQIWKEQKYRELQGTFPVIFLSFAGVKENEYTLAIRQLCWILQNLYIKNYYLLESDVLTDGEKKIFKGMADDMQLEDAPTALQRLSDYLYRYYGKKTIILLDEYDTPLQEAYMGGYWEEIVSFTRVLFNNTFKTNPYLERAVMTGITRVSKESLFSDLNNLKVITMTSNNYASCFGFTEEEVFEAMDEFGMTNKEEVKQWYDGFTIGNLTDIYNPWSIINFLDEGCLKTFWANTSSNGLVSNLLRKGSREIKMQFERLLSGKTIKSRMDEEVVFSQLGEKENAVWSLLVASGYLTVRGIEDGIYELELTSARTAPERFYHGFVLGLLVDLAGRYEVTSNRESGFGRYDVMLLPINPEDNGIILEFKVFNPKKEDALEETVQAALKQIEEKQYEQTLLARGIKKEQIRKYGFAFKGKEVLIGGN